MLLLLFITSLASAERGYFTLKPSTPWTKHGPLLYAPHPKKKDHYLVAMPKPPASQNPVNVLPKNTDQYVPSIPRPPSSQTSVEVLKSMELPVDMMPFGTETVQILTTEFSQEKRKENRDLQGKPQAFPSSYDPRSSLQKARGQEERPEFHPQGTENHQQKSEVSSGNQLKTSESYPYGNTKPQTNFSTKVMQENLITSELHSYETLKKLEDRRNSLTNNPQAEKSHKRENEKRPDENLDIMAGGASVHLLRPETLKQFRALFPEMAKKAGNETGFVLANDDVLGPVLKANQINIFVSDPSSVHIMSNRVKGPVMPPFQSSDNFEGNGNYIPGLNIFKKLYNSL